MTGQQGDATAGSVGIFWGIPGSGDSWTLLIDATPLAEAEPYGDFLTHPRGHYEVWSKWQKRPPRNGHAASQAIAWHEYEDFPRGRIVHDIKTGRFIVYADRRLQRSPVIAAIADKSLSLRAHSWFAPTDITGADHCRAGGGGLTPRQPHPSAGAPISSRPRCMR